MHTLTELLRKSASEHRNRIAVSDPDHGISITYRELDEQSDRVRDALVRSGIGHGDRVGIYAPKSVPVVSAIFGILKSGAAYVPVDASAPAPRNAGIFDDCDTALVVISQSMWPALASAQGDAAFDVCEEIEGGLIVVRRGSMKREPTESIAPDPDDVAYILYTSGSTGKPKGVVHTHRSALGFIDWCSETFAPSADDRFSSHAPFHFDLSILDIYVPLKHGAALVLFGEDVGKQPTRLASLISHARITVWYSTPSILRLLVEYGKLDQLHFADLRLVLFAGEVFPVKHLRALKDIWSKPDYFNLYGPTETNVCTYFKIPEVIPADRADPYPIGFTCDGDRTIVADSDGREVERGNEGELLASGATVMREYWNLPGRTSEVFVVDSAGTRWYRTGDVVRESETDGYLFVGRRDRMVKRRGYRVELGEIEAALYRHPRVGEAAVIAMPDEENGVSIKAFLTLSGGPRPTLVEMKRFCSEEMPGYMIPDRFFFPEMLPKTSTDKIDYQRLRELQ